VKGQKKFCSEV